MILRKKKPQSYTKSEKRKISFPSFGMRSHKKIILPLVIIGLVAFLTAAYFFVLKDIPKVTSIASLDNSPQSSKIYDRNGELLYTIYAQRNQTFVPIDKIPKDIQLATIAIEDKDFYHHGAIDIRGIARALYANTFKGDFQGGSTITQQLVKNSLLSQERTVTRKIREVILAYVVEALYSKDEILEMYLNKVSYGGTAYGVEAASQTYFGKPASQLTLAESAYLAGLPEAPSVYGPFGARPELGKTRQEEILTAMQAQGYISPKEKASAEKAEITFSELQNKIKAPHFVFYVKDLLTQKYGAQVVEQGGLEVITSLDLKTQDMAQLAVASEVAKLEPNNVTNGAALITDPGTGEILAMVGSRDFFDSENDGNVNVTIAKRQPGSSIKPINYATGLIKGFTASTPLIDNATCFPTPGQKPYCPVNYDGKYHGITHMRDALANSYNIPAVKMLKANGIDSMIATASAMGITTFDEPERYGLSLTLGGGEVKMIDMAQAFGVFANLGYKVNLQPILKVTDKTGKVLEEYDPPKKPIERGEKVIPEGVAFIISHILQDNGARTPAFGANSPLKINGYPVSVKTGTTNDYRDNWTIGYTPSFLTVVWVGNNDNSQMRGVVSGISGAAPIWHEIMESLLEGTDPEPLRQPASVVGKNICADSGLIPQSAGSCPTKYEYFLATNTPNKVDPGKKSYLFDKATWKLAKEGQTDNVEQKDEVVVFDAVGDSYCSTCPHPELTPSPTP